MLAETLNQPCVAGGPQQRYGQAGDHAGIHPGRALRSSNDRALLSSMPRTSVDPQQMLAENADLTNQLADARQELEETQQILSKVQKELNHYFQAHQQQGQLLEIQAEQLGRAETLIEALLERVEQQQ